MKSKFFCKTCNKIFKSEGIKKEYTEPVFGPCVFFYAICPNCHNECKEYLVPKRIKISNSNNAPSIGSSGFGCSYQ